MLSTTRSFPGGKWSTLARAIHLGSLLVFLLAASASASIAEPAEKRESRLFRALGWATFGVSAGDVISTELALNNGGYEANPLQANRGARIAGHVALPVLVNWGTAELHRDGHEKIALWTRVAAVALFGYATAHNLREAAR